MDRSFELQTENTPGTAKHHSKPRYGTLAGGLAIAILCGSGTAQANDDFQSDFDHQLGHIAANQVAAVTHLFLFGLHSRHHAVHRHYAGCGHGHYRAERGHHNRVQARHYDRHSNRHSNRHYNRHSTRHNARHNARHYDRRANRHANRHADRHGYRRGHQRDDDHRFSRSERRQRRHDRNGRDERRHTRRQGDGDDDQSRDKKRDRRERRNGRDGRGGDRTRS